MLGDISKAEQIYIATGHTDMRKSIDGLCAIVQQNFQMNPFQKSLFLFSGRKHDRLKILYWEGDGFLLLYKRLEEMDSVSKSVSVVFIRKGLQI